jgi:hypothetical protein
MICAILANRKTAHDTGCMVTDHLESGSPMIMVAGDHILCKEFENELTVINLSSGEYFALGGAAVEIWPLLEAGETKAGILAALAQAHGLSEDALLGDLESFLSTLEERGLVSSRDAQVKPMSALSAEGRDYEPPWIQSFDDLKDLLLLDPVHDVSGGAWPGEPRAEAP